MIETIILNYLKSSTAFPVFMEKPVTRPDEYILIEKTGSGYINQNMEAATLAVQSYSPTLFGCAVLNEVVKDAMRRIDINAVTNCTLNSDYNFTDTQTKEYRYQAVFDVVFYKEEG